MTARTTILLNDDNIQDPCGCVPNEEYVEYEKERFRS